jgi:glucose dehydrogenase
MRWYYQVVPGDSWDYDSTQQLILADVTINRQQRRVIMQANKNGFYYVLDRITGTFISGEPFATLNWAIGVDAETGRPLVRPEAYYDSSQPVIISPGAIGAHNWSPMSFNPRTGLAYIPSSLGNSSTYTVNPDFEFREGGRNTGTGRGGGARGAVPGDPAAPAPAAPTPLALPAIGPARNGLLGGVLIAWDPVAQKERWHRPGGGSTGGGTVTTAGNLVFQVLSDGRLVAYSADSGDQLLEMQTGQRSGMGPPMTYSIDGRQYVTLMGGRGAGAVPAPGRGRAGAPGVGQPPPPAGRGGAALPGVPPRMLTFVLDGTARLPSQP